MKIKIVLRLTTNLARMVIDPGTHKCSEHKKKYR